MKKENKRLFIFAAYDKDQIVDDTLVWYLNALSEYGDIIFTMDNNLSENELKKVTDIKNIIHAEAVRHNEYDFGSYKRGYQYATKKKLFAKYDWVYFVNDSVYGPLWDMKPILDNLETNGADLTGMIDYEAKNVPIQVQSWFVGMSKKLVTEDFIKSFFDNVSVQAFKQLVVLKYETALTNFCHIHNYKMYTFVSGENGDVAHSMYSEPITVLKRGIPFIKKTAIVSLPALRYLYPFTDEHLVELINNHAKKNGVSLDDNYKKPLYKKTFRLTVFSIPLITIYCQKQVTNRINSYKVYLFDKLPICKFSITH